MPITDNLRINGNIGSNEASGVVTIAAGEKLKLVKVAVDLTETEVLTDLGATASAGKTGTCAIQVQYFEE